jgi:hypothetical protein
MWLWCGVARNHKADDRDDPPPRAPWNGPIHRSVLVAVRSGLYTPPGHLVRCARMYTPIDLVLHTYDLSLSE